MEHEVFNIYLLAAEGKALASALPVESARLSGGRPDAYAKDPTIEIGREKFFEDLSTNRVTAVRCSYVAASAFPRHNRSGTTTDEIG